MNSLQAKNPELAVILVTPTNYKSIQTTISFLKKQTVKEKIEIVIVAPIQSKIELKTADLIEFNSYKLVEVDNLDSLASGYAAGIKAAEAPVVALGEDHSFPEPDWAENLIMAHQNPYAVVGPAIKEGNSGNCISRADLIIGYAPWLDPLPAKEMDFLPGHNSSYKRAILLDHVINLEQMLESETILHWHLRKLGHKLYLESKAKTSHVNFSKFNSWIFAQFYTGRLFAGTRIKEMSAFKRMVFVLASPLIPLVRFYRCCLEIFKPDRYRFSFLLCIPTLLFGLCIDGMGQTLGYLLGEGNANRKLKEYEFNRMAHLAK